MRTDDSGTEFEAEISSALHALVPDHQPVPGLAERVEDGARRRRTRHRMVAGLAVVVVVGGLAGGLGSGMVPGFGRDHDRDRGRATVTASTDNAPPTVDQSRIHQLLTPSVLPPSGGEIALITANPTDSQVLYGVAGTLDRWTGSGWELYRNFGSSLDSWGSAGQLSKLDADFYSRAIGIVVKPRGYGAALRLRISGLPVGFYRLTQAGDGDVGGILEIRDGAPAAPPLRSTANAWLEMGNVRAGTPTELRPNPDLPDEQSLDSAKLRLGTLSGPATVERLVGAHWQPVAQLATDDHPSSIKYNLAEFVVQLPPLPVGVYRMTRATTKLGPITGVFWSLPAL